MIAAVTLTVEAAEAAAEREMNERYAWRHWLDATDRALWKLEELNRRGVEEVSPATRRRLVKLLADLPLHCRAQLADGQVVQQLLDSVFNIQEELFCLRDPEREREEPDKPPFVEDPDLTARVLDVLSTTEGRTSAFVIAKVGGHRSAAVTATLHLLVSKLRVRPEGSGVPFSPRLYFRVEGA